MQLLQGLDGLRQLPPRSVLSIGNFDGIHLGHRRILNAAKQIALASDGALAVVTFEPHPMTVLRPHHVPPRLAPPSLKQSLLGEAGVDHLVILPPEPQILGLTAERFWHILRDEVQAANLVEGPTFRFGKGAAGTVELLSQWSQASPLQLHVVQPVTVPLLNLQVVPVSSSLVRFLIGHARVRDAAICLGRPYLFTGIVGKGFARGRELGTPTANLKVDDQLIPPDGVYAARCVLNGLAYPTALSIGTMPTFGENVRQAEAHLIGFNGDLYGQILSVEILDWIHDQIKFPGPEPLKAQIQKDIALTQSLADKDPSRPIASIFT